MGTWSSSITGDDTVADIVGFFKDQLKNGASIEVASAATVSKFSELEEDKDEGPLLWLALAHAQWKYGVVESSVLDHVRHDIANDHGLERREENPKALAQRKAVLAKFLIQIEATNPKPSAPPKLIVRKARFKEGDCLAVVLPDGRYTAALVLRADDSNPEYGKNLIACLDYLEPSTPDMEVFKQKKWLKMQHGKWNGQTDICWYSADRFKQDSRRIQVVGSIRLGWFLPKDDGLHTSWSNLGTQVLLTRAQGS